jgi:ubiquinone/menaquinone biosynthesis C-methylase UbiE
MNARWISKMGEIISVPQHHLGGNKATICLLKDADLKDGQKILLLGCGSGRTALKILQNYRCEVVGTDINPKAIENSQKIYQTRKSKLLGNATFMVDDLFHSSLPLASFDRIIVESVLIMLLKKEALTKIHELLKKEGIMAINEGLCFSADPSIMLRIEQLFQEWGIFWQLPTYLEWKDLFEKDFTILSNTGAITYNLKKMGFEMVLKSPIKMLSTGFRILFNTEVRHFFSQINILMKQAHLSWGYCLWTCIPK